jgi:Nucleotidyltransferase of unknown function (DUF6036)
MKRADLEHVVAAAAQISDEVEFVVVGSQAVLAVDDPPPKLLRSMEADLYPRHAPEKATAIDGSLGDGSSFHRTFGYYAHGVGPETAKAPAGWEDRLIALSISPRPASDRAATALCLEVHDLILAKCARGEERDWEFAEEALAAELVSPERLLDLVDDLPLPEGPRPHVRQMLEARFPD